MTFFNNAKRLLGASSAVAATSAYMYPADFKKIREFKQ